MGKIHFPRKPFSAETPFRRLYNPRPFPTFIATRIRETKIPRKRENACGRFVEGFYLAAMGNFSEDRKPRFLCLHGFRTSGEIMKKQVGKWPESVLGKLDLVFLDAPFPAEGKSDVEQIFPPPYYEWFQFNPEFSEYRNFDKCLAYIEDYMIKHGPFDGLMGFSQGAILSAALPGLQAKGLALTKVPKIKVLIIIGGAKFKDPTLANKAYSSPIDCPSLHFLGETDFLKPHGLVLLESFVEPTIIHHPKGHTVPRIDEKSLESMLNFIEKIKKILLCSVPVTAEKEAESGVGL